VPMIGHWLSYEYNLYYGIFLSDLVAFNIMIWVFWTPFLASMETA